MSKLNHPPIHTPDGTLVRIPDHACQRFIERVCPSVETLEEARDLIREAIHAGKWTTRVPKWADAGRRRYTIGFFVFEDMVFVVTKGSDVAFGEARVSTTLTRDEGRTRIKARKRRKKHREAVAKHFGRTRPPLERT